MEKMLFNSFDISDNFFILLFFIKEEAKQPNFKRNETYYYKIVSKTNMFWSLTAKTKLPCRA